MACSSGCAKPPEAIRPSLACSFRWSVAVFLGGISGVVLGTEQINILMHNTFYVPGHFHTTVVVGTALAFMSITYILVPTLFRREMILPKLCQIQPYLYGISMSVLGLVMMGAGTLGVSRRHWDMAFSDAPFQYEWPGAAYLMMGLTGVFGVIAVVGGALWIVLVVGSLLFGKKLDGGKVSDKPTPIPSDTTAASAIAHTDKDEHIAVPGTVVLALLLLVTFVLYYFVNWKYLSEVWLLS